MLSGRSVKFSSKLWSPRTPTSAEDKARREFAKLNSREVIDTSPRLSARNIQYLFAGLLSFLTLLVSIIFIAVSHAAWEHQEYFNTSGYYDVRAPAGLMVTQLAVGLGAVALTGLQVARLHATRQEAAKALRVEQEERTGRGERLRVL